MMADKAEATEGPVRRAFKDLMSGAAQQGWMVGLMEGAVTNLKIVRDDARENLARVPNHKLSAEAEAKLSRAIGDIEVLMAKLERIACGEGSDGR